MHVGLHEWLSMDSTGNKPTPWSSLSLALGAHTACALQLMMLASSCREVADEEVLAVPLPLSLP